MLRKGDVHFTVDYAPAAKFVTPDDANDGMHTEIFDRFSDAALFAKEKAASDFFGVTRITRQTCINPKYLHWECDHHWDVESNGPLPDEKVPTFVDCY